jgi:hypothetical protein
MGQKIQKSLGIAVPTKHKHTNQPLHSNGHNFCAILYYNNLKTNGGGI